MATVSTAPRTTEITLSTATAGPFELGFRLFDTSDVSVFVDGQRNTDWSFVDFSFTSGYADDVQIRFDSPLASGSVIVFDADLEPQRSQDYYPGDPQLYAKMNIELARLWSALSDTKRDTKRSLRVFQEVDTPVEMVDNAVPVWDGDAWASGPDASDIEGAADFAARAEAAAIAAEALLGAGMGIYTHIYTFPAASTTMTLPTASLDDGIAAIFLDRAFQTNDTYNCASGVITFTSEQPEGREAVVLLSKRVPVDTVQADDINDSVRVGRDILTGALVPGLSFATYADFIAYTRVPAVGTIAAVGPAQWRYEGASYNAGYSDWPDWSVVGAYSPLHYGAKGDGITDDGTRLNIALTAFRAAVEAVASQVGGPVFTGFGLPYRSTISVNMTAFSAWSWKIRDLIIFSEATGKISLDLTGARGQNFDNVEVFGSEANQPAYGIYVARAAAGGQEAFADQDIWIGVKTRGYFSTTAYDGYGQESLLMLGCEFWNSNPDAHAGVIAGRNIYSATSDYLTPITGATSHINCQYDRCEWRYLPTKQSAVSAITRGASTVITIASAIYSVGQTVVLATTTGIAGVESVVGTVTAVSGLTVTLDINSSGWSAYGGSGVTSYRGQTKSTLLLGAIRGHTFNTPYLVGYGMPQIEVQFPGGVKTENVYINNPCGEAYGTPAFVHFNTEGATSTRQVNGFCLNGYNGRALTAYMTSDLTYGSGGQIRFDNSRISMASLLVSGSPMFDDERNFALYNVDLMVPIATMVDPLLFAAFVGHLSAINIGTTTQYGRGDFVGSGLSMFPTSGSATKLEFGDSAGDVNFAIGYSDATGNASFEFGGAVKFGMSANGFFPTSAGTTSLGLSGREWNAGFFNALTAASISMFPTSGSATKLEFGDSAGDVNFAIGYSDATGNASFEFGGAQKFGMSANGFFPTSAGTTSLGLSGREWNAGFFNALTAASIAGSAVQSSATDATAGRLLKTGASATVLSASPALRMTYGGTANAITLTSGASISGTPPTGLSMRFRASAANTGAATIALDGGAAIACRTIAGVALPSGYVRADLDTVATFDGTYWVLAREQERGSNANGRYAWFADGTQICTGLVTLAYSGVAGILSVIWTYPATFSTAPAVNFIPRTAGSPDYTNVNISDMGARVVFPGTLTAVLNQYSAPGATGTWDGTSQITNVAVTATGQWY